ncbi:MAG TPA: PSD1 and planctomycete cytochrome C domain-containing protein [Gemmataceae bacterium]|nr:PSD1 and planctomycete cytochrome C domain-containing protein [Gemmataceae bacterium]
MKHLSRFVLSGVVLAAAWTALPSVRAADSPPTADQLAFFEKSIRPVLVKECYSCHSTGAEKIRGSLKLDTRDAIRKGGDHGPAVVPGDPEKSWLLKAIKHAEDVKPMPPKKDQLSDAVIADFEKWIAIGAPDPRDAPGSTAVAAGKWEIDIEKGRKFWAFQPPKKSPAPDVKDASWPKGNIDRYLLSEMESKGLKPVADADARTLIRRLSFDLIGLPPSPEDVESFVKDYAARPQSALEALVDKLLASPQFGERWGRHWLDVARYAESSGKTSNQAYPHAWRYRDYVIDAFNKDKPYDQFVREQLAGDLLTAKDDKEKADFLVATGFLAIGPKNHDERNPRQFEMDVADEQIDAVSRAFLGLTVACARCHDHKFDPIPQKDYYALSAIFQSTQTCYGTIRILQSNHPSPLIDLPKNAGVTIGLEPLSADRRKSIEKDIQDLKDQASKTTGANALIQTIFLRTRSSMLQSQLDLYDADGTPKAEAMGVREARFPSDGRVYIRGELDQPGDRVSRGFPQVLTTKQPFIRRGESGRRELADWIASTDNPLTARVMANRVWLHLMGRGLVPTPDNCGASGQPPSHPALLDNLAVTFAEDGWSVKKLIRRIVLSRAYQLSSQFDEKNFEADPENVLVWRMPKRRLEAEALRDAMLALSGRLDLTPPKGSPIEGNGEGNIAFRGRFLGGDASATDAHRTVYLSIVRDQVPDVLTLFDFPDPTLLVGERASTTIPAQSLYMMNNPFVIRQAEEMADRLGDGDAAARVTRAYLLCYARPPSEKELKTAADFVMDYSKKQSRRASWTALCQALFCSAEFAQR